MVICLLLPIDMRRIAIVLLPLIFPLLTTSCASVPVSVASTAGVSAGATSANTARDIRTAPVMGPVDRQAYLRPYGDRCPNCISNLGLAPDPCLNEWRVSLTPAWHSLTSRGVYVLAPALTLRKALDPFVPSENPKTTNAPISPKTCPGLGPYNKLDVASWPKFRWQK